MKDNEKKVKFIVPLSFLGGRENIVKVNNCATRLRLEVVDADKVDVKGIEKYYPAVQKISPTEVHIVVGTKAFELADELEKLLNMSKQDNDSNYTNRAWNLLPLLGGIDNIIKINNCATRLRLEIKDVNKIKEDEIKKYYPVLQKISNNEVHIVVGTDANLLADELKKFVI